MTPPPPPPRLTTILLLAVLLVDGCFKKDPDFNGYPGYACLPGGVCNRGSVCSSGICLKVSNLDFGVHPSADFILKQDLQFDVPTVVPTQDQYTPIVPDFYYPPQPGDVYVSPPPDAYVQPDAKPPVPDMFAKLDTVFIANECSGYWGSYGVGTPCKPGIPCLFNNTCQWVANKLQCVGTPYSCDCIHECTGKTVVGSNPLRGECKLRTDLGYSQQPVKPGWCYVHSKCYQGQQIDPLYPCQVCDPVVSQTKLVYTPSEKPGAKCTTNADCVAEMECISHLISPKEYRCTCPCVYNNLCQDAYPWLWCKGTVTTGPKMYCLPSGTWPSWL